METWKLLLITLLAAVLLGCVIGVLVGKYQIKIKRPGYKPLLSTKERLIYLACILAGAACIAVGVLHNAPGGQEELEVNGCVIAGEDGVMIDGSIIGGEGPEAGMADLEPGAADGEAMEGGDETGQDELNQGLEDQAQEGEASPDESTDEETDQTDEPAEGGGNVATSGGGAVRRSSGGGAGTFEVAVPVG